MPGVDPDFEMIQGAEGVQLRVAVGGQGPLCVLVHGWPESWYSWRHQIPALIAAGYRVAVPDGRGFGGSDKPSEVADYRMELLTADLLALIEHFGEQQVVLIGHDWGAPVVWHTALRYPERVRAVVGMSVPYLGRGKRPQIETLRHLYRDRFFYQLYFEQPGLAELELDQDVRRSLQWLYFGGSAAGRDLQFLTGAQGREQAGLFVGLPDVVPEVPFMSESDLLYYVEQFRPGGFGSSLNRYRNSERDWQWAGTFDSSLISQPALFIAGEHDEVLRFAPGVRLDERMEPYFRDLRARHLVPEAGHWVQQEQPEWVNRYLLSFLQEISAPVV